MTSSLREWAAISGGGASLEVSRCAQLQHLYQTFFYRELAHGCKDKVQDCEGFEGVFKNWRGTD